MRCPKIADLPPPSTGRTGWPWTEECPQLPEKMPDGCDWPSVTIVTPSFNQGAYIEETVRSILLQGYPKLEYIIIDGGSSDQTLRIIKKYEKFLAYWQSAQDGGQTQAINIGLARATGDVWSFINSDDWLTKHALKIVGLNAAPGRIFATSVAVRDGDKITIAGNSDLTFEKIVLPDSGDGNDTKWHGLGHWMPCREFKSLGGYNENFQYFFDLEMLLRFLRAYGDAVDYSDFVTVNFRWHEFGKSAAKGHRFQSEWVKILELQIPHLTDPDKLIAFKSLIARSKLEADRRCLLHDVSKEISVIESSCVSRMQRIIAIFRILRRNINNVAVARFCFGALRRQVVNRQAVS